MFRQLLYETVEISLDQIFGTKITRAFRFYVDVKSALMNPERFFLLVAELVGPAQAERLGKEVLSSLFREYRLDYTPTGKSFAEELTYLISRVKQLP